MLTMRLQPGDRVGAIRVEALLGRGGMSEVYRGFDEELGRPVALKLVSAGHRLSQLARVRFLREAEILLSLHHPNICRAYDLISDASGDVMVLELIEGENLRQLMARDLGKGEKLHIAEHIASALAAAHAAGIVHRDLKPENVMLTHSGVVKVLDFDLARPAHGAGGTESVPPPAGHDDPELDHQEHATVSGSIVGTVSYMSPEQARGDPLSVASDIYSFGILLHELFTGRPAYAGTLPARGRLLQVCLGDIQPVTGIGRELARLVEAMKSMQPSARPDSGEVLRRLATLSRRHHRLQRLLVWLGSPWTRLSLLLRRRPGGRNQDGAAPVD